MSNQPKVAFICVFHQSEEHRPNGFEYLNNNLESIFLNCKYPFKFFGVDNESEDKYELENEVESLQIIRNDDQKKTGTTGALNIGIKEAVKQKYDIIFAINDDLIFDESINNMIEVIYTHPKKDNAIFGPVSNNPNNAYQLAQEPTNEIFEISGKPREELNGFCQGMTRETVLNNLYDDDGNFFSSSPKHRWGGFEVEIGSRVHHSIVVGTCFVYHFKQSLEDDRMGNRGWRHLRKTTEKEENG